MTGLSESQMFQSLVGTLKTTMDGAMGQGLRIVSIPRRYAKNGFPPVFRFASGTVSIPRRYAKNSEKGRRAKKGEVCFNPS